jgi:hypothetical protein
VYLLEEHSREAMIEHIVPLSNSEDFNLARTEWKLYKIELHDNWYKCPCNHPIKELCHIRNRLNGNETYVGNICINKFMDINTNNIINGIKRISQDIYANVNEDLIEYLRDNKHLSPNEYRFLLQTKRKRKLSAKQYAWKEIINKKILYLSGIKESS